MAGAAALPLRLMHPCRHLLDRRARHGDDPVGFVPGEAQGRSEAEIGCSPISGKDQGICALGRESRVTLSSGSQK